MKTRILSILLFIVFGLSDSFNAQFVNYENDHGWNLGFNIGGVWQQPENAIVPYAGISGGLTFGKSIYEKKGAFFALDWRFRYLGGHSYGWDTEYGPLPSDTASSGYHNYRLTLHEYTLEGVLTLHKLRERTGIILYGFGGIGLTDYKVKSNYKDGFNDYNYTFNPTNLGPKEIAQTLKNDYNDHRYETTTKDATVDFMPSLGFGLGYQFTPHFSMGVEHKTTFALHDNLDGYYNGINDKYHYTAMTFRWNVFGYGGQTYTVDNNSNGNINSYTNTTTTNTTTPTGNKPLVNITNPATNNLEVEQPNYSIKANVYYVAEKAHVVFKQNGIQLSNFAFDPNTNKFSSNVVLQPGNNVFEIVGSNNYGSDQDSKIIIYKYEKNTVSPPIVTITNPSVCPAETDQATFPMMSTILNVNSKNDITVKLNGTNITNFSYNAQTNNVVVNLNLNEGANNFFVEGANTAGRDSKRCQIIYKKPKEINPPVVSFITPSNNPHTTQSPNINVVGKVLNVRLHQNINVFVNGAPVTNFTFNQNNKQVSFAANLLPGNNLVKIFGKNVAGTDEATTTIIYKKPRVLPPPVVTFINPATSPITVESNGIALSATVLHVNNRSGIEIKQNGNAITAFNFDPVTRLVTFNSVLNEGTNTFLVKGTNTQGVDQKETKIIYKKPVTILPPVISITRPVSNPYATGNAVEDIDATILNVNDAQNVSAIFNGNNTDNFTFNPANKQFHFTGTMNDGANTLLIKAWNEAGNVSKTQTIIYTKPPCVKPTIALKKPIANPFTTSEENSVIRTIIQGATSTSLKINGQSATGFNFNSNNGVFSYVVNSLTEGANSFEIIASNECGAVSEYITIVYEQDIPCTDPAITFINPSRSPYAYGGQTPNMPFKVQVMNVSNKNQLEVSVNNNPVQFNYNATTSLINGSLALTKGNNVLKIKATNECGTVEQTMTITFEGIVPTTNTTPCRDVDYKLILPNGHSASSATATYTLKVNTSNVTNKRDISVKLNGQNIPFTFNANSGMINANNMDLVNGENKIIVTIANACSNETIEYTINYEEETVEPACDPVSYKFILPNGHSANSATATYTLKVNTSNVASKQDISVKLNGQNIPFEFNANSGMINANNMDLVNGENKIIVTIANACSNETIEYNVNYEDQSTPPEPCKPPGINFTSANSASQPNYVLNANISNIENEGDIHVTLNGSSVPSSFNLQSAKLTSQLTLKEGVNTVVVLANGCKESTRTLTVNYTKPCNPITYSLVSPAQTTLSTDNNKETIKLNVSYVEKGDIEVKVNGVAKNFMYNNGVLTISNVALNNGSNGVLVSLSNDCSHETVNYTINYSPAACGPRFNPGNSSWEFCLVTPSGTYTRDNLHSNSSFTYSGSASSLFFKPIAGGGNATVNGQEYTITTGKYYLFTGNLTVDVSSSHPGSMGHWEVCITSNTAPVSGNGNNRPKSPCEETEQNGNGNSNGNSNGNDNNGGNGNNGKGGGQKSQSNIDEEYNAHIQKADMYFNAKKWVAAKSFYQKALDLKPNEKYPKTQIELIKQKISTRNQPTQNKTNNTNRDGGTKTNPTRPTGTNKTNNVNKEESGGGSSSKTGTNVNVNRTTAPSRTNNTVKPNETRGGGR